MKRLIVVPLLLATACSGGSSTPAATAPTPSPSITVPGLISSTGAVPADYLTRVDKTCATSVTLLRQRGQAPLAPTDPSHLTGKQLRNAAAYLQRGATIQRAAATAVARFAPPPVGADAWAVYVTAIGQYADGTQAEASAAKAGDVARFLTAAQRLLAMRTKALESGLTVGLGAGTACARLF
jgi:hypothetical protein